MSYYEFLKNKHINKYDIEDIDFVKSPMIGDTRFVFKCDNMLIYLPLGYCVK